MPNEVVARRLGALFVGNPKLAADMNIALAYSLLVTTYQGYLKDERRYYDRLWGGIDIFCIALGVSRSAVFESLECCNADL